jgi:hypothetical protein
MRLVLVHGRAQGKKSAALLREEWVPALRAGVAAAGLPPIADSVDVRVPFYGAVLDELVRTPPPGEFVTRGDGDVPDPVEADLLLAFAKGAGVTDADIAAEVTDPYAERGILNAEWVQAAGRALCKRAPWVGEVALAKFVRDVGAYLTNAYVRKTVDEIVAPEIEGGTAVVVGHSLGSVVTYAVLAALGKHADVPLYVTVGSPLGIPVVKTYLVPPVLGMPAGVGAWLNAADERDFVALYSRLDRDTFPADIENLSDVHNGDYAHSIAGYLSDKVVAARVARALAG